MIIRVVFLIILAISSLFANPVASTPTDTLRQVVNDNSDSVVLIYAIDDSAKDDELLYNAAVLKGAKKGSHRRMVTCGVLLSEGGIVVTSLTPALQNANRFIVSFKSELKAHSKSTKIELGKEDYITEDIKYVPDLGLAFLKIVPHKDHAIHSAKLGNDSWLMQDGNVLKGKSVAVGKAEGEHFVSEKDQSLSRNNFKLTAYPIDELKMHDEKGQKRLEAMNSAGQPNIINENIGGGVFDNTGTLIGIIYRMQSLWEHNYIIPVSVLKTALNALFPGVLKHSENTALGINLIKNAKAKKDNKGVEIETVEFESPAQKAGCLAGDVIMKFNNEETPDLETFKNREKASFGKDTVTLTILRNNKIMELELQRE